MQIEKNNPEILTCGLLRNSQDINASNYLFKRREIL